MSLVFMTSGRLKCNRVQHHSVNEPHCRALHVGTVGMAVGHRTNAVCAICCVQYLLPNQIEV